LKAIHGGGGSDRVQVLRVVRIAVLSVSAVSLLLVALLQPDQMSRALGALSVCALLFVLSGVIVARGAVRTASWVLMVGVLALITTTAFEGGGVNAPGIRALLVFVWVTGVLLGERAATGFGVACLVVIIALGVLQQRGVIDATTPYHPVGVAVLYGMYLALTIVVMRLFARSMARPQGWGSGSMMLRPGATTGTATCTRSSGRMTCRGHPSRRATGSRSSIQTISRRSSTTVAQRQSSAKSGSNACGCSTHRDTGARST
jgi:hypothetical protein